MKKKFIATMITLNGLLFGSFLSAKCAEETKNKTDLSKIDTITISKRDADEQHICLFLDLDKLDYPLYVYDIVTEYIVNTVLKPIKDYVVPKISQNVRYPAGKVTVDLEIKYTGNKEKDEFIKKFIEKITLEEDTIEKKMKEHLKTKKRSEIEKEFLKLHEKYKGDLNENLKLYKEKLGKIEKKKNDAKSLKEKLGKIEKKKNDAKSLDDFYLNLGKKFLIHKKYEFVDYNQTQEEVENTKFPDNLLETDKQRDFVKKNFKDKEDVKNVGKKCYDLIVKKYTNIIKTIENLIKESEEDRNIFVDKENKHKKCSPKEIITKSVDLLNFIRTQKKNSKFSNRISQAHTNHIMEANKLS